MNKRFLPNPEYRRMIGTFLVLSLMFLLSVVIYARLYWGRVDRQLTERDLAVMGRILGVHPELEQDLVSALTGDYTKEDVQLGLSWGAKYGYQVSGGSFLGRAILSLSAIAGSLYRSHLLGTTVLWAVWLLGAAHFLIKDAGRVYERIRMVSLSAEAIAKGDFDRRLPDEGEGEIAALCYQVNQMARRLRLSFDRLQSERELLKNMISDISHQLKTPLAAQRTFMEILLEDDVPGADRRGFLQQSLQQIDRMERLLQVLLKIARLEAGLTVFNFESKDLRETVEDAVQGVLFRANEKAQTLEVSLPEEPVLLSLDPQWLQEAVANIIGNAVNYTGGGGTIQVVVVDGPDVAHIQVRDNGTGIDPEELPHIFQRFYRGRRHAGVHSGGFGIGLALTKLVVEGHGGLIRVDSEIGRGTTFTIDLPKVRHQEALITKL